MDGLNQTRGQSQRQTEPNGVSPGQGPPSQAGTARPLSFAQERIFRLSQSNPELPLWTHIQIRLQGRLNEGALRHALNRIVARHEILRTNFGFEGGEIIQHVMPSDTGFRLHEHEQLPERPLDTKADIEPPQSLVLGRGPLISGRLVSEGELEHLLIISQHPIIADTWSVGVLIRELVTLYSRFCLGDPDPLPPNGLQFADVANMEREQMRGERLRWRQTYWARAFPELPERLSLPRKGSVGGRESPVIRSVPVTIPIELYGSLQALAHRKEMPLTIPLLCGWAIVLARWAAQEEVVIGVRMPNRPSPERERLVGPFENLIALRVPIPSDTTVDQLLKEVKTLVRKGRSHQDVSFDQILPSLSPTPEYFPPVQALFALNGSPQEVLCCRELNMEALQIADVRIESGDPPFEISLSLDESPAGATGMLRYDQKVFDREMIERLLAGLEVLLGAMVVDIYRPVGSLPVMIEAERNRILVGFNLTAAPYPKNKLIHEVFQEQAAKTPDAVALESEGRLLTYAALNEQANCLACHLREQGARVGESIPIIMGRSTEMIIAQLAVLKTGCAYVPIDPSLPRERQSFIIQDCGARLGLSEQEPPADFGPASLLWIVWQHIAARIGNGSGDIPQVPRPVPSPAYVMYTSGSTGTPKGVVVPHHAVNRLVINNGYIEIDASDCIAHCSNPAFDASTFEVWGALLRGARVLIVPQSVVLEPARLAQLLLSAGVTVLWLTVGLFVQYAQELAPVFSKLRYLMTGGDVVDPEGLRRVLRRSPPLHLLNAYGPTECTTFSTTYEVGSVAEDATNIPIGKPISNTRIYILDPRGQLVPIGVAGEIHIGGDGVALGYLHRDALTAERFVPDVFTAERGHLYRTGDLGRWRDDGNIEFLGRLDDQVKIRGFRVELGEIEAQLAAIPGIRDVVVVAQEETPGDKRLVAYLSTHGDIGIRDIRAQLARVLPDYMVPAAYVLMEKLPLTRNGKVDRRALPVPDLASYDAADYEEPQGAIEDLLSRIWRDLLGVDRIGRHHNFLSLGGHSLLVVRAMDRLREAGYSLEAGDALASATLADTARKIRPAELDDDRVPPSPLPMECVAITPEMLPQIELEQPAIDAIVRQVPGGVGNIQDICPLTPLQEGVLYHHLLDADGGDPYVMALLFSVSAAEEIGKFVRGLESVIERHDALRTAVIWEGVPRPVQVVCRRAAVAVEHLAVEPGRSARDQIEEQMQPHRQKLELRKAPIARLQVIPESREDKWYLLLQLHHLICDHEALDTVLEEIAVHMTGAEWALAAPIPYREFVAHASRRGAADDAEEFFRAKLGDVTAPTAPFGLLYRRGDRARFIDAALLLDESLAIRVRSQAQSLAVTPASLFHAVWALVLSAASGCGDVLFGSVLSGRFQARLGGRPLVGMLINTLPLRIRLCGVTARELVVQTHRELTELLAYEHSSLAVAQQCTGVSSSLPLFCSILNFFHQTAREDLGGRKGTGSVALLELRRWSNYPLSLTVEDRPGTFALQIQADSRVEPRRVMEYLQATVEALCEALERNADIPALSLPCIPRTEFDRVVHRFNSTDFRGPKDRLMHELFEEQVERFSEVIAVSCGDSRITYAELDCKANQVAHALRARGLQPDDRVALCLPRGISLVVGMLGILKAGGAYVPLDPRYPPGRLAYMIENSAPVAVVTDQHVVGRIRTPGANVMTLDDEEIVRQRRDKPGGTARELRPEHLAYVIYTSGSTGAPKGVMVEHRSLLNLIQWHCRAFRIQPGTITSAVASVGFDAFTWEVWPPLAAGGTLIVAPQELSGDSEALLTWWVRQPLEVSFLPTPIAEVALGRGEWNAALRTLLVGGDRLRRKPGRLPFELVNNYGPTESTVVATSGRVDDNDPVLHIGRPIGNGRTYILDQYERPLPVGATGEIYVGGAGVARGYLGRPELTAERFSEDPFAAEHCGRMYRTGDLGRWRPDGSIEYLGRNDDQVKIRGNRVELGEIETHLVRQEGVAEAVVLAREDIPGDVRLVAYVTPTEPGAVAGAQLRCALLPLLPEYMVPGAIVVLERLPLTVHGKIDRRALPPPATEDLATSRYEPPVGKTEEVVCEIWRRLLSVTRVGRDDNFFDLGGHSLLATQLLLRVREELSVNVAMSEVFEHSTLRGFAARLDRLRQDQLSQLIKTGGGEIDELLARVSAISDSGVKEWLRKLKSGVQQ